MADATAVDPALMTAASSWDEQQSSGNVVFLSRMSAVMEVAHTLPRLPSELAEVTLRRARRECPSDMGSSSARAGQTSLRATWCFCRGCRR